MDDSEINLIIKDANDLLTKAIMDVNPRVHIPSLGRKSDQERHDWMLQESRDFHAATDSCIRHWLDHGHFESHYDEEVLRQTFWRLVMADDYLPFAGSPILSDETVLEKSPKGVLDVLLLGYWRSDGRFADEYFHYLAAGEKQFPRHHQ
jgi:hypothetical protein